MKKTFLITILAITTLLSACQNTPDSPRNSADQAKQEKASTESKIILTVDGDANIPVEVDVSSVNKTDDSQKAADSVK